MSRLRHAAALFIEAGRALGQAEQCRRTRAGLEEIFASTEPPGWQALGPLAYRLDEFRQDLSRQQALAEGQSVSVRTAAEASMAALEHPGGRLARRLLRAARAARGAWRAG